MLLAASEADAATLQRIAPTAQIAVFPNTLPPVPLPSVPEREIVVFSGNLEYHPNVSTSFFRYHVWPLLRERYPRLGWRVVGKNYAVARYLAGDERIEVAGPVDDAVAEIARARVAIVPLLAERDEDENPGGVGRRPGGCLHADRSGRLARSRSPEHVTGERRR